MSQTTQWIDKRDSSYFVNADGKILGTVQEHGKWRDRYYYASSFEGKRMESGNYITRDHAKRAIERHVAALPSTEERAE